MQHSFDSVFEVGKFGPNDFPNFIEVNAEITVRQNVAKPRNLAPFDLRAPRPGGIGESLS